MRTAQDIMTREVVTVTTDTPVKKLAELLWQHRISGVPVLDRDGRLVGVATESDLIDQNKKLHIPTMISLLDSVIFLESSRKTEREIRKMSANRVGDICSEELTTVAPDTPLDEVATIMAEKKIHTLPVVDSGGGLLGVIGKSDIIRTLTTESGG